MAGYLNLNLFNRSNYDFNLPQELIAQKPVDIRHNSRLLVYDRKTDTIEHKYFYDIPQYFDENDLLVLNNTKVIPAKLISNCNIDIILINELGSTDNSIDFKVLTKFAKLKKNKFYFNDLEAEFIGKDTEFAIFRFYAKKQDFYSKLENLGNMPLPPYIKRKNPDISDKNRYQTIYAQKLGSIASPTAGLHFTEKILEKISRKNTLIKYLTLHVGIGTFKPIKTQNIQEHKMMEEEYFIDQDLAELLKNKTKKITSVGTTSTRTIESFIKTNKLSDKTDLYICPGHKFYIDRLITNFHVPNSTPLMLVSAFIADGLKNRDIEQAIKIFHKIYKEAIEKKYRFFSYGDSMIII